MQRRLLKGRLRHQVGRAGWQLFGMLAQSARESPVFICGARGRPFAMVRRKFECEKNLSMVAQEKFALIECKVLIQIISAWR